MNYNKTSCGFVTMPHVGMRSLHRTIPIIVEDTSNGQQNPPVIHIIPPAISNQNKYHSSAILNEIKKAVWEKDWTLLIPETHKSHKNIS